MNRATIAAALTAGALLLSSCDSGSDAASDLSGAPSPTMSASAPTPSGASTGSATTSAAPTATGSATPSGTGSASGATDGSATALPDGTRSVFPEHRVVAYYGGSSGPALGVLGEGSPEQAAKAIERTATMWKGFGRPVLPAMELIVTVAQGSAGKDGTYSSHGSAKEVQRYLDVAKKHGMLLVMDFQPGRGEFLPQVKRFEKFLLDPSVGVALDAEWKVGKGQKPGQVIGHSSAASINAVSDYVSDLVQQHSLPEKLFVIHQFTTRMLPDRQNIKIRPGLATVLHADGYGSPRIKKGVYRQLAFPKAFHAGFKLFIDEDTPRMKPAAVMALRPQPELITYQ